MVQVITTFACLTTTRERLEGAKKVQIIYVVPFLIPLICFETNQQRFYTKRKVSENTSKVRSTLFVQVNYIPDIPPFQSCKAMLRNGPDENVIL